MLPMICRWLRLQGSFVYHGEGLRTAFFQHHLGYRHGQKNMFPKTKLASLKILRGNMYNMYCISSHRQDHKKISTTMAPRQRVPRATLAIGEGARCFCKI
jgi:hypothetical protein